MLDLVAVERGTLPTMPHGTGDGAREHGLVTTAGGHAGLHLDDQARNAYRRRLAEIDDDIDDATMMNDQARLALAMDDREYLVAELSRAVGLGGRARLAGATAERAADQRHPVDSLRPSRDSPSTTRRSAAICRTPSAPARTACTRRPTCTGRVARPTDLTTASNAMRSWREG